MMKEFGRGFGYWIGRGAGIAATTIVVNDVMTGRAEERVTRLRDRIKRKTDEKRT